MSVFPRSSINSLADRLPPHSLDAERCSLAALMLDKQIAGDMLSLLDADAFYLDHHRVVFDVLKQLYALGKSVDAVILHEELDKTGKLEEIGGAPFIGDILASIPNAAHGVQYATIVREKALRRALITVGNEAIRNAYGESVETDQLLDHTSKRIFELAEKKITNPIGHLGEIAELVYHQIEDKNSRGLETQFYELDDMLNGLQNGEMVIVAARPSMGKTAFAMNVIEEIAAQNKPCAVFSLEMSKQQLAQRLMCSRSGVDSHRVRKGQLKTDEYHRLAKVVHELRKMPIYVDDSPGLTTLDLRTKCRRLKQEHDIQVVMIDYMQLMENPGPESRQQQITEISRGVKAVARELNVPVIALSQLNRASESREGHKPRMSDLRESGSIEQDADVIMLLHREDYYHQGEANYVPTGKAEVIIAKQRNGPTGTVELLYDGSTVRFKNLSGEGIS
jgi:replicative DNA helicase